MSKFLRSERRCFQLSGAVSDVLIRCLITNISNFEHIKTRVPKRLNIGGGTKKSISHSNMQNMMPIFYLGVNWMCWIKISHALSHRTRSEASRTQFFTKIMPFFITARNSASKRRFCGSPWNSNLDLRTHSGSFPRIINRMMRNCYHI